MTAPAAAPPRPRTRWILPEPPDPAVVRALCDELLLPEPICRLLAARGHAGVDDAKRYLRPRLDQLLPPEQMLDLSTAVERIVRGIRGGETILIHGDYDVDGMCSTTLLLRALSVLGGKVVPFIPHRSAGYDLGDTGVQAAVDAGATIVVTCDCGTSAVTPVGALRERGIDVIITDHHLPGGDLPNAYAVLNPRRPGCLSGDKDLAAVGVAFKLALAVTHAMSGNENVVYGMLDLVALATIADIAPLRGENRVFARYGLKMLAETKNLGLRALIRAAGLDGKPLTAGRVGYIIAPRLNAVGRIGHALRGVELLTATTEHEANSIARDKVDEFARCFNDAARAALSADDLIPELRVDLEVALGDLTPGFESLLRHLEPCGVGNPAPMLLTRGVRLAAPPKIVGKQGLKLRIDTDAGEPLDAIGWTLGARLRELDQSRPFDMLYRLERDEYQGVSRLQARLADFRV
jgi:single-stranded-DNA-specific exonuclease